MPSNGQFMMAKQNPITIKHLELAEGDETSFFPQRKCIFSLKLPTLERNPGITKPGT